MIWLLEAPEGVSEAALQGWLPLLDAARRKKLADFALERSRVESILAGALLRYAYTEEYGAAFPEIGKTERGKPVFSGPDAPQFNLSHCSFRGVCGDGRRAPADGAGTVVACALSRFPVGVDVQELRRYDKKLRRILSDAERAWVEEADSDARFTALWTRKEAYGKALGVGIGYELAETDFSGDYETPRPCGERLLWTVRRGGCQLSCCAKEPLALRTVPLAALGVFQEEL